MFQGTVAVMGPKMAALSKTGPVLGGMLPTRRGWAMPIKSPGKGLETSPNRLEHMLLVSWIEGERVSRDI